MKFQRSLILSALLALVLLFANALNVAVSGGEISTNYPAVVCPATPNGLTTAISMPSTKSQIRLTGTKSTSYIPSQTLRYMQEKAPTIVDSQGATPVVWQIRKGVWAGATICSALQTTQWFVGGAADVTSKARLILINSGLSAAIVDVQIWNEIGAQPAKAITLRANSSLEIGIDSLAPGSQSVVVNTQVRSGRVTSYLIDERGRGLRALGGDLVNFTSKAAKEIFIPAIPHTVRKVGTKTLALPHSLRVFAPGEIDARITVKVFSSDGAFIPAGFENRVVKSGLVFNFDLKPSIPTGKFGIVITSDQPIVASVYSQTLAEGKSDFIWSTSASELSKFSLSITGLSPHLIFIGQKISLEYELFYSNGKKKRAVIAGEDIASLKVPEGVRAISFIKANKGIYGAGLIATKSGYGYFPLSAGSALTKSSVPVSNIRVLTP